MKDSSSNYPPALERGLIILDFLASSGEYDFSIKEVASSLEMPYASVYRIMKCLLDYGYIMKTPSVQDRYRIGYKFLAISKQSVRHSDFITVASPYILQLSTELQVACKTSVLTSDGVVTIDQALPQTGLAYLSVIGLDRSITASASGKIMVSYLPKVKRLPYFTRAQKERTLYHATGFETFEEFNEMLDNAREKGFYCSYGEFTNVFCLAVALFDFTNKPVAGMSLSSTLEMFSDEKSRIEALDKLTNTRKEVSSKLGCTISEIVA